jgi:(E)-4-hydroxy-3-methylbut-2-enyl-diphosphate synthase
MAEIKRRKSVEVKIGNIPVGGQNPIVVQSMTNTDTADVDSTVKQIKELADVGSEIVRVTVNTEEAAQAIPFIVDQLEKSHYSTPVVGDFHYNGHLLLKKYPDCAKYLAKYRINPGNSDIGKEIKNNFATMVEIALRNSKPIRIGANWGSLDKTMLAKMMDENLKHKEPLDPLKVTERALVMSAFESGKEAEKLGMSKDKIILSAKISHIQGLLDVYRELASLCDYALHLGLTEAGMGNKGVIASSMALGILLQEGIGDTIRVSITPTPTSSRTEEVIVAQQILQSLDIRNFTPQVTSCPGCGRTTSTLFQSMAEQIQDYLRVQMGQWKENKSKAAEMKVAVMGCIVNGPGESKHANLGISLPGTAEDPKAPVYVDGKLIKTLQGPQIVPDFIKIIEEYVNAHY